MYHSLANYTNLGMRQHDLTIILPKDFEIMFLLMMMMMMMMMDHG